jgi:hypothetical protein
METENETTGNAILFRITTQRQNKNPNKNNHPTIKTKLLPRHNNTT